MKHATIIYPAQRSGHSTLACITAAFETFMAANSYRRKTGKTDLFTVELTGTTTAEEIYGGMFTIKPQRHISEITKTDLIIIPSSDPNHQDAVPGDDEFIEWLTNQYKLGADIVSICSGAFLLASSGLLDGKAVLPIGLMRTCSGSGFLK